MICFAARSRNTVDKKYLGRYMYGGGSDRQATTDRQVRCDINLTPSALLNCCVDCYTKSFSLMYANVIVNVLAVSRSGRISKRQSPTEAEDNHPQWKKARS